MIPEAPMVSVEKVWSTRYIVSTAVMYPIGTPSRFMK